MRKFITLAMITLFSVIGYSQETCKIFTRATLINTTKDLNRVCVNPDELYIRVNDYYFNIIELYVDKGNLILVTLRQGDKYTFVVGKNDKYVMSVKNGTDSQIILHD